MRPDGHVSVATTGPVRPGVLDAADVVLHGTHALHDVVAGDLEGEAAVLRRGAEMRRGLAALPRGEATHGVGRSRFGRSGRGSGRPQDFATGCSA